VFIFNEHKYLCTAIHLHDHYAGWCFLALDRKRNILLNVIQFTLQLKIQYSASWLFYGNVCLLKDASSVKAGNT